MPTNSPHKSPAESPPPSQVPQTAIYEAGLSQPRKITFAGTHQKKLTKSPFHLAQPFHNPTHPETTAQLQRNNKKDKACTTKSQPLQNPTDEAEPSQSKRAKKRNKVLQPHQILPRRAATQPPPSSSSSRLSQQNPKKCRVCGSSDHPTGDCLQTISETELWVSGFQYFQQCGNCGEEESLCNAEGVCADCVMKELLESSPPSLKRARTHSTLASLSTSDSRSTKQLENLLEEEDESAKTDEECESSTFVSKIDVEETTFQKLKRTVGCWRGRRYERVEVDLWDGVDSEEEGETSTFVPDIDLKETALQKLKIAVGCLKKTRNERLAVDTLE